MTVPIFTKNFLSEIKSLEFPLYDYIISFSYLNKFLSLYNKFEYILYKLGKLNEIGLLK